MYNTENRYTNPTNKPMMGWVIAEPPAAVRMGGYMVLLVYNSGTNMVMMGPKQRQQMIDTCQDAIAADKNDEILNRGFGFGDRIFKMFKHLATTNVMVVGQHYVKQHAMDVTTEMEEFYNMFRDINEGTQLILLQTTMPIGVFGLTFKFQQAYTDASGTWSRTKRLQPLDKPKTKSHQQD